MAKDIFDDLRSMMGCYEDRFECHICGKKENRYDGAHTLILCDNCNSYFCRVSVVSSCISHSDETASRVIDVPTSCVELL